MHYIKTVSSKGQITLPKAKPGGFVALSVQGEALFRKARDGDVQIQGTNRRPAWGFALVYVPAAA